jgi:hypothetical protein
MPTFSSLMGMPCTLPSQDDSLRSVGCRSRSAGAQEHVARSSSRQSETRQRGAGPSGPLRAGRDHGTNPHLAVTQAPRRGLAPTQGPPARVRKAPVLHTRKAERLEDPVILAEMHDAVYGDVSDRRRPSGWPNARTRSARFDAVIHNASVLRGADVLGVSTIAPYIPTAALIPPRRSIYLSSSMHHSKSTDLDTPGIADARHRAHAYEDSELYVTALAMAMAMASRSRTTMAHAVDPGWVPTRMGS